MDALPPEKIDGVEPRSPEEQLGEGKAPCAALGVVSLLTSSVHSQVERPLLYQGLLPPKTWPR